MSDYIVEGSDATVMNCLADPATMGVVWRGAWSSAAMKSARNIVRDFTGHPDPGTAMLMTKTLAHPSNEARDFVENLRLVERFFQRFDVSPAGWFGNYSRIEAAYPLNSNGEWHVDPEARIALGVPIGVTSEYIPRQIPGYLVRRGDFVPADAEEAERLAVSLPNDALLVMKGRNQAAPYSDGNIGLVHRRPNSKINLVRSTRLLVQLSLGPPG